MSSLFHTLTPEWQSLLKNHESKIADIEKRISRTKVNPELDRIFRAIAMPISDARVVIVGQDPYPHAEDACGLAFSVPTGRSRALPPTLRNILTELADDIGPSSASGGDFSPWVSQGVVLLNRILTTEAGTSLAHKDWGWQEITTDIFRHLVERGSVAILWGNFARELSAIVPSTHRIESAHPSPLSSYRGFFGSKPFSRANQILVDSGRAPIAW